MNRRILRATIVLTLAAAFILPPLSQVICSDGCVGGACEDPPATALCDSDASGGCCGNAEPAEELAVVDPTIPILADQCQTCPCFEADQLGNFLVPERTEKLKLHQHRGLASVALSGLSSEQPISVFSPRVNAHDPPLYQRHHALLI